MEKQKRKTRITNLKERVEGRRKRNTGRIHPAKQENEFFSITKNDIYKQITK